MIIKDYLFRINNISLNFINRWIKFNMIYLNHKVKCFLIICNKKEEHWQDKDDALLTFFFCNRVILQLYDYIIDTLCYLLTDLLHDYYLFKFLIMILTFSVKYIINILSITITNLDNSKYYIYISIYHFSSFICYIFQKINKKGQELIINNNSNSLNY